MSSFEVFLRKNKYPIALVVVIAVAALVYFGTRENKTLYSHRDNRFNSLVHRGTRPDRGMTGPPQEDVTRYQNRKELLKLPPLNPTHLSMAPVKSLRETIETRTPLKPIIEAGKS